jgi:hypothetical protein
VPNREICYGTVGYPRASRRGRYRPREMRHRTVTTRRNGSQTPKRARNTVAYSTRDEMVMLPIGNH